MINILMGVFRALTISGCRHDNHEILDRVNFKNSRSDFFLTLPPASPSFLIQGLAFWLLLELVCSHSNI